MEWLPADGGDRIPTDLRPRQDQEMNSTFTISHHEAQLAVAVMLAEIQLRSLAGVMVVADAHGELIALLRMDASPLSSITIATNKAFTAARERTASSDIGKRIRHPQEGFDIAYFGDPRFIGWGGGLPVMVDGQCVGAVAVSGLPEAEDIEVALMGVAAILRPDISPA